MTSHPTADIIYEIVRKRLPHISLGTVYRNLEVLAEQGVILKLNIDGTRMRFDGNISKHYHIRCIICGRVDDISIKPDINWRNNSFNNGYDILGCKVDFFGKCPECRKKECS